MGFDDAELTMDDLLIRLNLLRNALCELRKVEQAAYGVVNRCTFEGAGGEYPQPSPQLRTSIMALDAIFGSQSYCDAMNALLDVGLLESTDENDDEELGG